MPLSETIRFGPFELDPVRRQLRCDGEQVALTGKPLDLLLTLVEERNRVVDRDELLRRVWPDVIVEEANLTQNISVLRKALGEGPGENAFIVTVPGRGYRFVARVTQPVPDSPAAEPPAFAPASAQPEAARRPGMPGWIALALAAAAVLTLVVLFLLKAAAGTSEREPLIVPGAIAVLPILSGDLGLPADATGIALTDALITRLTAAGQDVRPTRAILEFADPRRDTADEAGLQLGVGFVVTGVAREILGHARLSLQIVRSTDGAVVWAETVDADGTLASSEDLLLDRATARLVKILGAAASGRQEVSSSEPPS